MINDYKEKWKRGEVTGEYNDCRYCEDKALFARNWLLKNGTKINLDNPQNIVDRICRQKLDDVENPDIAYIRLKTRWSDKINVYNELENIGLKELQLPCELREYRKTFDENILNELDKRPSDWNYIIKCNHGSGYNVFYTPTKTKHELVIEKMNTWLSTNYAYISGLELQYKWIKPGYLVQPVYVKNPLDWSFWCENGEIEGIGLTKKSGKNFEEYIAFVNEDGKANDWYIGAEPQQLNLFSAQKTILDRMIPYVKILSKPFKFVRCDMYCINSVIYFGELTFSPCSGVLDITYRS